MSRRREAKQVQIRTEDQQAAAKQFQTMKDGIAAAKRRLVVLQDDLNEVGSFVYVCIEALRAKGGDDANPDIAKVLGIAYTKLVLDVKGIVREALKALGQDGAK